MENIKNMENMENMENIAYMNELLKSYKVLLYTNYHILNQKIVYKYDIFNFACKYIIKHNILKQQCNTASCFDVYIVYLYKLGLLNLHNDSLYLIIDKILTIKNTRGNLDIDTNYSDDINYNTFNFFVRKHISDSEKNFIDNYYIDVNEYDATEYDKQINKFNSDIIKPKLISIINNTSTLEDLNFEDLFIYIIIKSMIIKCNLQGENSGIKNNLFTNNFIDYQYYDSIDSHLYSLYNLASITNIFKYYYNNNLITIDISQFYSK
jgi:hypothetical protein